MENPIINAKPHKVIDSTAKALPQTVKAIDTALSGVIKILGYPTSFLGEYANYSLQKVKNKLSIKLNGKDNFEFPQTIVFLYFAFFLLLLSCFALI